MHASIKDSAPTATIIAATPGRLFVEIGSGGLGMARHRVEQAISSCEALNQSILLGKYSRDWRIT
jgi:hypothetical protein